MELELPPKSSLTKGPGTVGIAVEGVAGRRCAADLGVDGDFAATATLTPPRVDLLLLLEEPPLLKFVAGFSGHSRTWRLPYRRSDRRATF